MSLAAEVVPFRTMELLEAIEARRRRGAPVYRLDLGEPSLPMSEQTRKRISAAILDTPQSYTESRGRPALRQAIAQWYASECGVDIDAERIIVTAGASAALTLAVLAGFNVGQTVAMARPGYPAYRNVVRALGRVPVEVRCGARQRFRLTADCLRRLPQTPDGILFASPANPTGAVLSPEQFSGILDFAKDTNARVISDEIYQSLIHGHRPLTAAGDERAFAVNSFSKFWRMTGWRIGWLVCPPDLVRRVDAMAQHLYLCPSAPGQTAALVALSESEECRAALETYRKNGETVIASLRRLGVTSIAPAQGAFYVYADLAQYTDDSLAFAKRLLSEAGVAVAPGIDFDPVNGATWVRFSTAGPPDALAEGLRHLENWLGAIRRSVDL